MTCSRLVAGFALARPAIPLPGLRPGRRRVIPLAGHRPDISPAAALWHGRCGPHSGNACPPTVPVTHACGYKPRSATHQAGCAQRGAHFTAVAIHGWPGGRYPSGALGIPRYTSQTSARSRPTSTAVRLMRGVIYPHDGRRGSTSTQRNASRLGPADRPGHAHEPGARPGPQPQAARRPAAMRSAGSAACWRARKGYDFDG